MLREGSGEVVVVVVVAVLLAMAAREEAEGTNSGEEAVMVPVG